MKCEKCGYVSNADFKFCKNCGAPAPEEILPDCPTPKILACVKSKLYFAFCILIGISAAMSNLNLLGLTSASGIVSIPKNIIILVIAIGAWLIYFEGQKNQLSQKHFKVFSIGVFLKYIWGYFGGVGIILIGALACVFPFIVAFFQAFEYGDVFNLEEMLEGGGIFAIILAIVIGVLIILLGIVAIIITALGRRSIHRFTKSLYTSVENGEEQFAAAPKVQFWLFVFAAINIAAELFVFLANPTTIFAIPQRLVYCAALIVGAITFKTYFKNENT